MRRITPPRVIALVIRQRPAMFLSSSQSLPVRQPLIWLPHEQQSQVQYVNNIQVNVISRKEFEFATFCSLWFFRKMVSSYDVVITALERVIAPRFSLDVSRFIMTFVVFYYYFLTNGAETCHVLWEENEKHNNKI